MLRDWWKRAAARSGRLTANRAARAQRVRFFKPQVEEIEPRIVPAGTWTQLANLAPDPNGIQTIYLLPNGTVMANGGSNPTLSTAWYALTPDATGSYVNGTWSTLASSSTPRLDFTADVLSSDQLFVYGGEYSPTVPVPPVPPQFVNSGEIYNELTNTWSPVQTIPLALDPSDEFGDDPSEVLPDGTILAGYLAGAQTFIYNVPTNTWSAGATKLNGDRSDEESWEKLPGGDILSYNIWGNPQNAQRYDPGTNTWIASGAVPVMLHTAAGDELGPGFLLPSNGEVLQIGATSNNALYTPSTNSWVAGPVTPGGLGANDAPGAVEPNGMVLFAAGQTPAEGTTTSLFEYDPTANTISAVPVPAALAAVFAGNPQYNNYLMVLPSGQILLSDATDQLWVYTPTGGPQTAWRPTISGIVSNGGSTYTLTGTQLTGLDEGSNYGDENQNATNYPIVQITDSAGKVAYARSFNWSTTEVATGATPETVQFVLPNGLAAGPISVVVIANGIPSQSFELQAEADVYYPLRYVYNTQTHTYDGNLTVLDVVPAPVSNSSFTILFPKLPKGATLVNATGYTNGVPFITVNEPLTLDVPIRAPIEISDPLFTPLSTFFVGFPVEIA